MMRRYEVKSKSILNCAAIFWRTGYRSLTEYIIYLIRGALPDLESGHTAGIKENGNSAAGDTQCIAWREIIT